MPFFLNSLFLLLKKNSNINSLSLPKWILLWQFGQRETTFHGASILNSFVDFNKQPVMDFYKNKIKLVLLARNQNVINQLVTNNNVEFCSLTLLKPNKDEREEFFELFKNKFTSLSPECKEKNTNEYRDVISLTEGMSLREFFQFSKIDKLVLDDVTNFKELTFKELYKLITFNKKESEWEKFDLEKMKNIYSILSKRVQGQENAINITKNTLIRSFTGMNGILHSTSDNKKPKGVLFFVGPTGTGKTELAKSISEFVFGDENRIIRFDMSEFNHEHSDQRLIGAPPGYVGYDAGGELTNAVKQKPFSILLFDEIEKANGKILDKFLQILEDGRLTSSQGEIIDFSETFIIFTSNIGAKDCDPKKDKKEVETFFKKEVKKHFVNELGRPELLNRIGEKNIVPFMFLTDEKVVAKLVNSKLEKVAEFIKKERSIKLNFKNDACESITKLVQKSFDHSMGGRGIVTQLETIFIDELSKIIFENFTIITNNQKSKTITNIDITVLNNKISFEIK